VISQFQREFLAGWLGGKDIEESLRLAVACNSLSTRAHGGTEAQPTLDEVLSAIGSA
jgi:sugar/nucleoside kinase (ribokinase family)